jgi:hypothetical protein
VTAQDVLKFCTETHPTAANGGISSSAGSFHTPIAADRSPPAECYLESAALKQSSLSSADAAPEAGGAGPVLFTPKQRLLLCANAGQAAGPINCATSALSRAAASAGTNTGVCVRLCVLTLLCLLQFMLEDYNLNP